MDKALFLEKLKAAVKEVPIKALGGVVSIRVLTGKARDEWHKLMSTGDGSASYQQATLVAATVVDANDQLVFSSADVPTLQNSDASALDELATAAMTVNNIGVKAEEAAAKN